MKKISILFNILFLIIAAAHAQTQPSGSGTQSDPYRISTTGHLFWISTNDSSWDKYFVQTAAIGFADADFQEGGTFYNEGKGFFPIGCQDTPFTGWYNGNGYAIQNVYINRPSQEFVGFFGFVDGGTIKNLELTDTNITGDRTVGGLAGKASPSYLTQCGSSGTVTGSAYVGGFAGKIAGPVTNCCYSVAEVTGDGMLGGFAGKIAGPVTNCYSRGAVNGGVIVGGFAGRILSVPVTNCYTTSQVNSDTTYHVGGFAGGSNTRLNNCFWGVREWDYYEEVGDVFNGGDIVFRSDIFGIGNQTHNGPYYGVYGKLTVQLKFVREFFRYGWDFAGESAHGDGDYWDLDPTQATNDGYPHLSWQCDTTWLAKPSSGDGSSADTAYKVSTLNNLFWLSQYCLCHSNWNKYFKQTRNIDASPTSQWKGPGAHQGFLPIGMRLELNHMNFPHGPVHPNGIFSGTYDGQGYSIDNLYIKGAGYPFPFLSYFFSLPLSMGLFGSTADAAIAHIGLNSVDISGYSRAGGLVGFLEHTGNSISNCYCTGEIYGGHAAGGLIGHSEDDSNTINKCYSTAHVSVSDTGGPSGGLTAASHVTAINSFWDTELSGQSASSGGTGKTTQEMKDIATFTDTRTAGLSSAWDFTGNPFDDKNNNDYWRINPDKNNGYPFLVPEHPLIPERSLIPAALFLLLQN